MDVLMPKPGSYVVAVSGGVDSVVLLHILQQEPGLKLTVAHFDHGMREDSAKDRRLVQSLALDYGLPFVYDEGRLGKDTSEATAREARYSFLRSVQQASGAVAIITAHHQDDILETSILNMLRGTGRKGLTSLQSQPDTLRPLLKMSKPELIAHAKNHSLKWHEDTTNQDTSYQRNYVRHQILPKFDKIARQQLLKIINDSRTTNKEIDILLTEQLGLQPVKGTIDRLWFNQLPHAVAKEMMAAWLRQNEVRGFESKTLERLVTAAKTATAGKVFPVMAGYNMVVEAEHLALTGGER